MLARKKCIYDKRKRGQDYKKTAKKINPAKEEIKDLKNRVTTLEKEVNNLKEELEKRTLKARFLKLTHSKRFWLVMIILSILSTFLILDLTLRLISNRAQPFYRTRSLSPLLFTISYILVLLTTIYCIGLKKGKWIYGITITVFGVLTLTQFLHFKILNRFFGITDLFLAGEGSDYFGYVLSILNFKTILFIAILVALIIFTIYAMHKINVSKPSKRNKIIAVILTIILVFTMRFVAIKKLGTAINDKAWNSWNYPRNIYNAFNNNNKSMQVAGLYEYTFRNITKFVESKVSKTKKEDRKEVTKYFEKRSENVEKEKNDYTDLLKDKNLIMIMVESLDTWNITEETMPTLNYLKNNGLNFINRYSPVFGGGATFNTEFASITGLYTPNNGLAAFNYDKNNYDFSLPNLFRQSGYSANSFHMNYGTYYNRKSIHERIGFEKHYALLDEYPKIDTRYDTKFINNDEIYNKIVPEKGKFMSFITTYSMHLPYDSSNSISNKLKEQDGYKELMDNDDSEMAIINVLSRETDNFIKKLLERLDKDNKLDDTAIVIFSDHNMYGYSKYKNNNLKKNSDDSNLVQNVPFIIWSEDIKHKDINTILDTADLTPTIANLFGLSYNPSNYLGTDVFSSYHDKYVYFSNYSWYDGKIYYKGEKIDDIDLDYVKKISEEVNEKISINDKILNSDYFATLKNK